MGRGTPGEPCGCALAAASAGPRLASRAPRPSSPRPASSPAPPRLWVCYSPRLEQGGQRGRRWKAGSLCLAPEVSLWFPLGPKAPGTQRGEKGRGAEAGELDPSVLTNADTLTPGLTYLTSRSAGWVCETRSAGKPRLPSPCPLGRASRASRHSCLCDLGEVPLPPLLGLRIEREASGRLLQGLRPWKGSPKPSREDLPGGGGTMVHAWNKGARCLPPGFPLATSLVPHRFL